MDRARSGPDPRLLAAVFAGGFAGTLARAGLVEAWPPDPGQWPWATFAANVAGAFLLGWVAARVTGTSPAGRLWGTGFCGALTTFSALQLEVLQMLDEDRVGLALGYVLGSVAAGLVAVGVASALTRRVSEAT